MDRAQPPTRRLLHQAHREEALQALLADARRGALPDSRRSGRTFGDACAGGCAYIEHDRQRAPTRCRTTRARLGCVSRSSQGHAPGEDHDRADRGWRERLLDEGKLARRTVQKMLVALFGILKLAKRRGWITANPSEDVERVTSKRTGDFNVLTPVEVEAVARGAENAFYGALFTVAAFTGLRNGRAAGAALA